MAQRPSARVAVWRPSHPSKADVVYLACGAGLGYGAEAPTRAAPLRNPCANRSRQARGGCCGKLSTRSAISRSRAVIACSAASMTLTPTPSEAAIAAERTAGFLASSIASLLASAGSSLIANLCWQRASIGLGVGEGGMISPIHLAILTLPYSRPANRKPVACDQGREKLEDVEIRNGEVPG
jgi:hypothetical protein